MTRAAAVLSLGEVLGKLATLLMLGLIARGLGVADFGAFSLGLGLGLLLASATTLGLDQRLVQLTGTDPGSVSARLSSLLALRLLLGAVVIGGSALVLPLGEQVPWPVVLALVAAGCCDGLTEAFRSAASTRHVQSGPALVLVVQRFLGLGLVVLTLWLGAGLIGAALGYLTAAMVGLLLMAATAWRYGRVRPSPFAVTRAHVRDYLVAVRITGLNDLASMALFRIDVVIVAWLAGTVAVGYYTAAYRLLETVLFISWSVARVILPALADTSLPAPERSRTVSAALVAVTAVYLPYTALLLTRGEELVALLFGTEFGSTAIILWLAPAPLFFGAAQIGIIALLAIRPDSAVLLASTLALAVNVGLDLALVPVWGPAAAAAATTAAYAVQATVVLIALRRRIAPLHVRRALAVCAGTVVVAGATMLLPGHVLTAGVVGGLVYVSLWSLASRRWDRPTHDLVRSILRPGTS
ncbi:hypothetical protein ASJ30_03975 [Janibacter indicus]|uniref:Uncharacterized protein n=2 Tax=Janibacter indicus TaxID=857417 RepID=A0A1L3MEL7_9MICO|nr:hypothetical protein ASJ30_03975 [Janibacter indicus]